MRLMRITTNYPAYLKQFYNHNRDLCFESYSAQYHLLMNDCFHWADFWTHALRKFGYEVWEPVGNAEAMQKVWAQENGIKYGDHNWLYEITTAQVESFQPDILFVNDYKTYSQDFLHELRERCPNIKLVIGWCGAPYSDGRVFNAYDLVLSNIPGLVSHFQEKGHQCELFQHAFEPKILSKIRSSNVTTSPEQAINFSFIGSIVKKDKFHNQREHLLKRLVELSNLQVFSDIYHPSRQEQQVLFAQQLLFASLQLFKKNPAANKLLNIVPKLRPYLSMSRRPDPYVERGLAKHIQPGLYGLSMYQKLSDSLLTLNTHIDVSSSYASNMRLYEATGVGTCLITEAHTNLSQLFEPDLEVVTYKSIEEIVEKVTYLLNHTDERQRIARAGQKRTLREHTFEFRAEYLDLLITKYIKRTPRHDEKYNLSAH